MVGVDLDVRGLAGDALAADERLVDQDLGVRQGETLALGAACQQESAHRGSHAHADSGDIALDIVHGIVDCHTVRDGAAGAVDVEVNVLLRVLAFQIQQLGNDHTGRGGVDILAQHDNTVIEQSRKNIVAALTASSLFDNIGYKAHGVFPP